MNENIKKRVSIVGCGWLGLPLAQHLLAAGYTVKGTTTTAHKLDALNQKGIQAYVASLDPEPTGPYWDAILDTDCLIVDIPPRRSQQGGEFHPQQMAHLAKLLGNTTVTEIIYVSSTSVYPELSRPMVEEDVQEPAESSAPPLVEAELTMASLRRSGRNVAVLRSGGLMGYDRIPGKYVRGKKDLTTGEVPVNYVHRDDLVAIIALLLGGTVPNSTFNVVAPLHPSRREVYVQSCLQFGWEVPTFKQPARVEPFKLVLPERFVETFDYVFQYPDPLKFYYLSD